MRPPCNLVSLSFLTVMSTHDEAKAQGRQDQTAKAVESNVGTDGDSSLYPGRVGRPLFPSQMSIMGRDGLPASLKICRTGHRTQLHSFDTHHETETGPQV